MRVVKDIKSYWKVRLDYYKTQKSLNCQNRFAETFASKLSKNSNILDIGAGLCSDSIFFLENGHNVLATDIIMDILSEKEELYKTNNFKTAILDISKGINIKNKFDAIYAHLSLHFFDDKTTKDIFIDISNHLQEGGFFGAVFNCIYDIEIKKSKLLKNKLYLTPSGLLKRYFSVSDIKNLMPDNMKILLIDYNGKRFAGETNKQLRVLAQK